MPEISNMAAVWRTFSATRINLFSAFSSKAHHINAYYQTNSGSKSLSYVLSSVFLRKESLNQNNSHPTGIIVSRSLSTSSALNKYYIKPNYLKKCGRRDQKRREMFRDYETERAGLRMIKKSDILPSGVRQRAAEDLRKLPLNSNLTRVRNRCVLTDRGRGIVGRFRVSRMMFRYFAEKGLIAGVQKAQW